MVRDLFHALRIMRANPAFTLTAILTLALGIGTNTAMFTVIRAVLLKPLEYPDPDRLVEISGGATNVRFEEMRNAARSYNGIAVSLGGTENITLTGGSGPEVLKKARVSANFLSILGISPLLGRSFRPEEDVPGGPPVAMISAALWQRRFGGDPLIAGRTVTLAATPYTIIGVLPAGFRFPYSVVDVWMTRSSAAIRPLSPVWKIFARLKPRVDIARAGAELAVLRRQYAIAHPEMLDARPKSIPVVTPLKDQMVANVRPLLWMLSGAVGFVLLIACANVASLLLARASYRSREFAVRAALGARRGRLIGQLLAESVLLAFAGGILGVILAGWCLRGITRVTALDLPRVEEIHLDGTVLGFAVLLSIVTGVLFGLVPSLGASRPDLAQVLRATGAAAASAGTRGHVMLWLSSRWVNSRGLLVVAQVALSMVLLIGAALSMESLAHLYNVDLGFEPAHLLTMQIALPESRYDSDPKKVAFYNELLRRIESLPGVRGAAIAMTLPHMGGYPGTPVQDASQPPSRLNERPIATYQSISPQYFRTMEIPLRRGREFTARDNLSAPPVAIIDESLARRFWPDYPNGPDPIGQRLFIGAVSQPAEIVGVVADAHQALEGSPWPGVYSAAAQSPPPSVALAVRTTGAPLRFADSVRGRILAIDRDQPVSAVRSMDDLIEAEVGQRRLILSLLGSFAGIALLLTVVGIYGAIAYSVAQRTQELGVRCALGAHQGDILRLVMGQGLGLTLAGIAIGIGGALALTRVMKSLLFHVSATDPATFGGIALMFVVVALAATYIPGRRAARLDPAAALR
jgi:predicted permease